MIRMKVAAIWLATFLRVLKVLGSNIAQRQNVLKGISQYIPANFRIPPMM
jgi:hypothetical protein